MLIPQWTGADAKHLVVFLFTCKEIMCPVIRISLFCPFACHKNEFMAEANFLGGPDIEQLVVEIGLDPCIFF